VDDDDDDTDEFGIACCFSPWLPVANKPEYLFGLVGGIGGIHFSSTSLHISSKTLATRNNFGRDSPIPS